MKKQAVLTGYTGREENKMNEMQKKQKIVDYINSIGDDELIALHNTYCCAIGNKIDAFTASTTLTKHLKGEHQRIFYAWDFAAILALVTAFSG